MSIVMENLCKRFDGKTVLHQFTWTVDRPMVLMGPSGCGKTTILSLISGLMRPTSGDIKVAGKSPSPKDNLTGYMFQRDNLLPWRTIEKNI